MSIAAYELPEKPSGEREHVFFKLSDFLTMFKDLR